MPDYYDRTDIDRSDLQVHLSFVGVAGNLGMTEAKLKNWLLEIEWLYDGGESIQPVTGHIKNENMINDRGTIKFTQQGLRELQNLRRGSRE